MKAGLHSNTIKLVILAKAVNSVRGNQFFLIYDRAGKITKMIDQEKEDVQNLEGLCHFKYNSMGKPVEIEMENVGDH